MNRSPDSEKKLDVANGSQKSRLHALDPKLLDFVKALARAAAREDHRRAAEAALLRPEPDGHTRPCRRSLSPGPYALDRCVKIPFGDKVEVLRRHVVEAPDEFDQSRMVTSGT